MTSPRLFIISYSSESVLLTFRFGPKSASIPNIFVGKALVASLMVKPLLIILGAKKASKEYKLHGELVTEELQIRSTFLHHWSSKSRTEKIFLAAECYKYEIFKLSLRI